MTLIINIINFIFSIIFSFFNACLTQTINQPRIFLPLFLIAFIYFGGGQWLVDLFIQDISRARTH